MFDSGIVGQKMTDTGPLIGIKQLCNQGGFCYVPQCAAIKTMGTDGLTGIKRTSTFCNQGRDVVMECECVTDTYTKYVCCVWTECRVQRADREPRHDDTVSC